jgi:cytochrome P450
MVDGIRRRCVDIMERIAHQDEVEFVSAVAAELPIQMLAELFAVPQDDRHKLFEWSNIIIGGDDPDIAVSREHVMKAIMEMVGYAMQLYQDRVANPGDDLISMLVASRAEGEPMNVADFMSAFILLVVAGNETTRNSISGGMYALAQFPDERAKLLANPSLVPRAVDEIIRWVHPVIYMRRTCLEDTELGGRVIRAGDKLALWYLSGNRDESKWADPYRFDVSRDGPRHLSFGYGQHLCIGWRLAEIQLTVALEEMLKRFPDFSVVGPVSRMRSNFLSSIKQMQVRLRA